MQTTLAAAFATTLQAIRNCERSGNAEWLAKWPERIDYLESLLPSGSGLDNGVTLDRDASNESKLVFLAPFHHMDSNGFYAGWSDYRITVRPGFSSLDVRVSGRGEDMRDYIGEIMDRALSEPVEHDSTYPPSWGRKAES